MTSVDDLLLLPEGTRLVHIGPHKTGTTTLQGAFHAARREIERQGVRYATPHRQAGKAVRSVFRGRASSGGASVFSRSHWTNLVRELERSSARRVLISAEGFADASPEIVRRMVADLDPAAVHVVATIRPLARILPSQWQQYVQNGLTLTYEAWLRSVFDSPDRPATPSFWHRHRHDRLLARWADVVGLDRVTAVVVDDRDHGALLRTFERFLGLEAGSLTLNEGIYNRSLTTGEVELVRAMHAATIEIGVDRRLRLNLFFHGAAANMKLREPDRTEARIETPAWAQARAEGVSRDIVEGISSLGVRVLGDLETLVPAPTRAATTERPSSARTTRVPGGSTPWPSIAGRALLGVLIESGLTRGSRAARNTEPWPDDAVAAPARSGGVPALAEWSTPRIRGVLLNRLRSAAGSRLAGPIGLVRRGTNAGRRKGRGRKGQRKGRQAMGRGSIISASVQAARPRAATIEGKEAE